MISSLPGIKAPSLAVVGENDKPYLAASDYMAGKIRNARKVVVPAAGHASKIDNPTVFNAAILGFLSDLRLETA